MPKNLTGQGYSENTSLKQQNYAYFLGFLLPATRGVMGNPRNSWASQCFQLIDFNAGPGWTEEYGDGSPMIALQEAQKRGFADRRLSAFFVDQSTEAIEALRENLVPFQNDQWDFRLENRDNSSVTADIMDWLQRGARGKSSLGLIYTDPNGYNDAPLESIIEICHQNTRLDVLVHISATSVKRQIGARAREGIKIFDLEDFIKKINKKKVFVREPYGTAQWSFLYLTNWADAPELKKKEFYDRTSRKGKEIFKILTRTAKEIEQEGQLNLFGTGEQ
jgi:three-Cys-motif partner protein